MQAEVGLLPSEPATHVANSAFWEHVFCQDYSLSKEQLHRFYELKEQANVLFEQPNQRWDLIKSLYADYFGTPGKVQGKQWTRLGFQGQYPQSDFRGGGVLSLQLIINFVRKNKDLVRKMQTDPANFFFAITAINIAFWMKKYFHLADFLEPVKDQYVYCNRRALKNFCRVLVAQGDVYAYLHETFLKHFYTRMWVEAQRRNQNILLQFNALFEQLTKYIKAVFEGNTLENVEDFIVAWRNCVG